MTKCKNTRHSLTASVLSVLVCCAMLAGTTFAWFTDSVSNTGNRITAGNLAIDLLMDKTETGAYESIADGRGDLFSESGNGFNWEPGKTEIVYLAVENEGSLAASVDFYIHAKTPEGLTDLSDALEYVLLEDTKASDVAATDWAELSRDQTVFTDLGRKVLLDDAEIFAKDTKYLALAVHMSEDAGNKYQNAGIEIDAIVDAAQMASESDAFGKDYDKAAKYSIETADELSFMLAYPEDGATYVIADDITWEAGKINALKSASYTIDLNGHTVTLNGNTGYAMDRDGVDVTLTVLDQSNEQDGKLKSGGAKLIVCNEGDVITGNGYLVGGSDRKDNIVRGDGEWTNR